jgi:hypothetical protein
MDPMPTLTSAPVATGLYLLKAEPSIYLSSISGLASPPSYNYNLCAMSESDLKIAAAYQQPPKLQYVWQDLVVPENWFATRTQLIRLGAGRFCIAKAFQVRKHRTANSDGFSDDDWGRDIVLDEFLVLSANWT